MIALSDLLTPITADEAFATFVSNLVALGIGADQWRKGGVARTILRVVAITYAGFSATMVAALSAGFLDFATGGWLILLAYYVYGVTAIPATQASGAVTLVNAGGGTYTYLAGQATFLNSTTKVSYTNVNPFTLNPTSTLTGLQVQATTFGSASSSAPGGIDTLVTAMLGVSVTNPLAVVGQDAEADPALRTRCRNKLASLSVRGPRNAYAYAVQSALNAGVPVNINRVSVVRTTSTGNLTVYCASPSGAPTSGDLAAAAASIEETVRPETVTVTTLAVSTVTYAPAITVWAETTQGVSADDVKNAVSAALATFIAMYPIGGLSHTDPISHVTTQGLFGSGVSSVIGSASPARIFAIDGATDQVLTAGQVVTDGITLNVQMATAS
ncbi:MAG TPA: baseplate J/gp47 family protein [Polyangiaceae bacterium]